MSLSEKSQGTDASICVIHMYTFLNIICMCVCYVCVVSCILRTKYFGRIDKRPLMVAILCLPQVYLTVYHSILDGIYYDNALLFPKRPM